MRALLRFRLEPKELYEDCWKIKNDTATLVNPHSDPDAGKKEQILSFDGGKQTPQVATEIVKDNPAGDINIEYYNHIIKLFKNLGYDPIATWKDDIKNIGYTQQIFDNVPEDIKHQEMQHLVMLGYISHGQAHFVVSMINASELHVRLQANIFSRIRAACEDIYDKIDKHDRAEKHKRNIEKKILGIRIYKIIFNIPFIGPIIETIYNNCDEIDCCEKNKNGNYSKNKNGLIIGHTIEVMEPKQHSATIKGKIIDSAYQEVKRNNHIDFVIVEVTFIAAVILFFITPFISAPISDHLIQHYSPDFTYAYIEGALERTYSAFLVTAFISGLGILLKMRNLRKYMPIKWDSFDEPSNDNL